MIDISVFKNNLFEAGAEFFDQLGIRLNSNTASSLEAKELLKDQYKDKDIFAAISETYFLGLVDDSIFDVNAPPKISLKEATGKNNGLMVFAVKLTDSYLPNRGEIAGLTRAFNRVSTKIPVVLLLKYGNLLSFAASERTKFKQEWREGEKIGKISLLKDINIDSPHTGHLKILDDLKVAPDVTTFNALYKQWQEVFDVQLLNKKFYQELANWYFRAIKTVTFPDDVEKDEGVRNATNVIRLITRLIFVWFVKEKGLVHDKLFDPDYLKDILNYSDKTGSVYYKAILQNLFFATLNTDMNKDTPGSRKFVNRQYGIHYFYRYERFFKDRKKALALFEDIPFLNGGLFECLDKNAGQDNEIRIDCFSNSPRKADRLVVPDDLFFSPEQAIDLNEIYGTKGKSYKVRGIINILNSYKFTIAENTPVEEEIALDPELLGKVFENLLASYNPETQTTARKQTGSFYTPREIVNYMVDESLIAYLSSEIPSPLGGEGKGEGDNTESRLRKLLTYTEEPHQFTVQEVDVLINAIDNAKILDPACGSGAFPMGVLHKMVHILHKLDPDNEKWKQRQIDKVEELIRSAEKIDDSTAREQIVKDLEANKQNIEDAFEHNELDYGRKLYLIENCIYGIDIQPIAVQIAKLRFFISLIVNQRTDTERKNLGIRPLPNLETKFVAANTLIGIEKPEQLLLRNPEIDIKEKELKQVREKHFSARTPKTKDKYRIEDARLRTELAELFKNDGFSADTTHKLAHWDPYDQNSWADFFDPEWMFGIKDGFDVVIGNPPYVRQEAIKEIKPQLKKEFGDFYCGTADIYTYFYKCGIDLLKEKGHLCFIAPNKFMRAGYGKNTRNLLATEVTPKVVIDFCDLPIFDATTYPSVLLVEKNVCCTDASQYARAGTANDPDAGAWRAMPLRDKFLAATFTDAAQLDNLENTLAEIGFPMPVGALKPEGWNLEPPEVLALMEKLRKAGTPLGEYVKGRFYRGILTGLNEAFVIDKQTRERLIAEDPESEELIKPWLRGRDIKKWKAEWAGLYLINIPSSANREWPWTNKKSEKQARDTFKHSYPAVHDHLSQREDKLRKRDDQGRFWWELRSCVYDKEFERTKIMYAEIATEGKFLIDNEGYYSDTTSYIMASDSLYLIAVLNSKLFTYMFSKISSKISGGFFRWKRQYMEQLSIFPATDKQNNMIIDCIEKIIANPDSPEVLRIEKEINKLIYDLYDLTPEEIEIVENSTKK